MAFSRDIRPSVRKESVIPYERLSVIDDYDSMQLKSRERCVLFVYTEWSGPAIMAFKLFTRVMEQFSEEHFDIVVLDNDGLTDADAAELFGDEGFRAGGWGEVIWIRDGVIRHREIARHGRETLIEEHTRDILT